jgi:hypothetical protein
MSIAHGEKGKNNERITLNLDRATGNSVRFYGLRFADCK